MNRRIMILATAATAVAAPALAQTLPQTQPPAHGQTGSSQQWGEAEKTHAEKSAMIGTASLQMANIALEKAARPKVKEFAQFEHDEQTTVAAVLKSMEPDLSPPSPPAEVAQAIDRLKQLKPGLAFDREFVAAQVKGHEMLRGIQQDYLNAGKDREAVNTTKLILGMINEHLTLLSDLQVTHLARL